MFGVYIGYEGHDLVYCLCRVGMIGLLFLCVIRVHFYKRS